MAGSISHNRVFINNVRLRLRHDSCVIQFKPQLVSSFYESNKRLERVSVKLVFVCVAFISFPLVKRLWLLFGGLSLGDLAPSHCVEF